MDYHDEDSQRAKSHIDRIRRSGGRQEEPESPIAPLDDLDAGLDDVESSALERARERSERLRRSLGGEPAEPERVVAAGERGPQRSPMGAVLILGGLLLAGVVIIIGVALLSRVVGGGALPFLGPTPTPTLTPTPTETPMPTETSTPVPTPTPPVPELNLPVLTCIYQTRPSCYEYCAEAAHEAECNTARALVEQQGADPSFWLDCISPPGADQNVGDPQQCLIDAWLAANQSNP